MSTFDPMRGLKVGAALALLVFVVPQAAQAAGRTSPSRPGAGSLSPRRLAVSAGPIMGGPIHDLTTGLTFATLQDAIDEVSTMAGDTLQVEVAVHAEGPVEVTKSLTLQGQTGAEVLQMTQDTGNSGDARGWFLVDAGVDLQVRDLTFDGNGFKVFQGFRHKGTGSFERCHFQDIQYDPSGPSYAGTAIVAFGGDVDVIDCTFEQIGRVGVLLFGSGIAGAVVEGNQYTGKGDGDFLDYGIEVGAGAVATLRDNTVNGCRGVASFDGSTSAGFLISTYYGAGTVATVEANTLMANTVGINVGFAASDTATVGAAFNRIVGNTDGAISTSDSVIATAENNWWGCNGGPGAVGCDPVSGLVDADPWLLLALSANPGSVLATGSSALIADLTGNSDGADTSGLGTVPDDIPVAFGTTLGSVAPAGAATLSGLAGSLFTAGAAPGTATVSATVDNQTVQAPIDVLPNPSAVPTLDPKALAVLAAALATVALLLLSRSG